MNRSSRLFLLVATVLASLAVAGPASAAPAFTLASPVEGERINGHVSISGYAPVTTTLTNATCAISNSSYSAPFFCQYMDRWISTGHTVDGGEGYKTISVVVTDNTGSTSFTRQVYNDLTDPNTYFTGGTVDNTTITGQVASWQFDATETSTFECNLDNAGFSACTSPYNASGLADGQHSFSVRAIDLAGRTDGSPATRTVNVFNGAPLATFGEGPDSPTNNSSPGFQIIANRPDALLECRLDGAPDWTDCSDRSFETSDLIDGDHLAEARAYLAGPAQVQATPVTYSFTVDTVAPTLSLVAPKLFFGGLSANFELSSTATDIEYVACYVDGNYSGDCGLDITHNFDPSDAAGEHYIEWRATDNVGNEGPIIDWVWTQFPDLPQTAIATKPDPTTPVQVASFTFTSETATEFECGVDGGAFASCPASYSVAGLSAGPHVLQARAKDPAGQLDDSPSSAVFTLAGPPVTPILRKPTVGSPALAKKALSVQVTGASSIKVTVKACTKKKIKGKKKTVCKSAAKGTATVAADGKVTVKLSKKLKKKVSYKVTIVVTGADGQTTTVVKTLKLKS